jgi:hypothetical protein
MTQTAFAKLVGCKPITIQRIENRTLKMSHKLADKILEATGAKTAELAAGRKGVDVQGNPYTNESYEKYKAWTQQTQQNVEYYLFHLTRQVQLLLICSQRSGQDKLHSAMAALQDALAKIATDFDVKKNIYGFLIEKGSVRKRTYRVSDLRKFPDYAQLIGFKDNPRFNPDKTIKFDIPNGWINEFDSLAEKPMLSEEIERKFAGKTGLIDWNLPMPDKPEFKELIEGLPKALYWTIVKFIPYFSD